MRKLLDRQLGYKIVITGIFCLPLVGDLLTPLDIAEWALYPVAILLAFFWNGRTTVLPITVLAIALTVAGLWLSPADTHVGQALVNRFYGSALLIAVGWLCVKLDDRQRALAVTNAELSRLVRKKSDQLEEVAHQLDKELTDHEQTSASLQSAEERFRLSVEETRDYAIFMLDPAGRVATWGKGAERIEGYPASEILGQHFCRLYPPEEIRGGKPDVLVRQALKDGRSEAKGWRIRRDGTRFWAHVVLTPLYDGDGRLQGFSNVMRDCTPEIEAQEALQVKDAALHQTLRHLRALAARLITVQEEERRRISRELHDEINQKVAIIACQLDLLRQSCRSQESNSLEGLEELQTRVQSLANDIRVVAHQLHPSILVHMGLGPALESYIDEFGRRESIALAFSHKDVPESLPVDVALCLYRVAQECLGNIVKHAHADSAAVTLTGSAQTISLVVHDSGVGFDPKKAKNHGKGLGMVSMQERVRLVNGKLTIKSRLGHGTRVEVRVPLQLQDTQVVS